MASIRKPQPSRPARPVTTTLTWGELALDPRMRAAIEKIRARTKRRRKAGSRVLFHGPPRAGQTLAAALLAREPEVPFHRIDLSQVVSRYLGETERNLTILLSKAEEQGAIILLDEADALLGKRTVVTDAHDRFANLEIAYLLEKIEAYAGIAILTTNLGPTLDDAFLRRLRFIIELPKPDAEERRQLWQHALPSRRS